LEEKAGNELEIWFNLSRRTPMKTIIHVNQHIIKKNKKNGSAHPVITVKNYKKNRYANEVIIEGPCKVVYSPDKPLSCGAHVWIETESNIIVIGEEKNISELMCQK
jgi:hypothetical protein